MEIDVLTLKLLSGKLIVEPEKIKSTGLIIRVDEGEAKEDKAIVINIGPKVSAVTVGDIIQLSKYAGAEMRIKDKTYRVIHQMDISTVEDDSYKCGQRAIFDRVIIDAKPVVESSIILLDDLQEKPGRVEGMVLSCGGYDINGEKVDLEKGTRVGFPKNSGIPMAGSDGKDYYIMRYTDLILKFIEDEKRAR